MAKTINFIAKHTSDQTIETTSKQGNIEDTTASDILQLLGDPEKMVEGWRKLRSQESFTQTEQFHINTELRKISKFWENQIEDPMDPQDDGVFNYALCQDIIVSWEKSCKAGRPQLLPINNGIKEKYWNEIFEGYAMKRQ